jgi:hypothetical protein
MSGFASKSIVLYRGKVKSHCSYSERRARGMFWTAMTAVTCSSQVNEYRKKSQASKELER